MTRPRLLVAAKATAPEALAQIREAGVPGAPVVNDDGSFVGSLQAPALAPLVQQGEGRTAGRLADVEAMTLPSDAGLDAVIDALPASKGGWVPVLDDDMNVLGIISTTDLVRGWQHTMRASVKRLSEAATSTSAVEGVVPGTSDVVGRPVSSLTLPRGAVVVSTVRHGTFLFPDGGQRLEEGDLVTVLARADDVGAVREVMGFEQ
jgi:hypothetical protein